jgi:hypothetical protein
MPDDALSVEALNQPGDAPVRATGGPGAGVVPTEYAVRRHQFALAP